MRLKPCMLAEPVLVGREKELQELKEHLDSAVIGKGTTVFISGEAGSGKTRLLTEFLRIAKQRQLNVLTGWCLSDAAIPYFPFEEAFDAYFSTSENEDGQAASQTMGLKTWLTRINQTETNPLLANMTPQAWRDQAFSMVAKELLFLSEKKPLILALEDIQWADSASLSLLHYLARQVISERILILATFRSEDLNVKTEGHGNDLSKVILHMGRDDLYSEVKLSNLGKANIRKIAESMLGGAVQSEFVDKIASETIGNPLFVVESLRVLYKQGSLYKKSGQWSLQAANFETPKKVKDIILQRLEALKPNQKTILDIASVIGENFDPSLIAAVISHDKTDVLRELNEIARSTLMVYCDDDLYRFKHSKFREMLYLEIPSLLRKEYHLRLAQKMEVEDNNIDELLAAVLAYHFAKGENKAKAIKYSLESGKFSLSRFSNSEAISKFSYIIDTVNDDQEYVKQKLEALEGLGDAFNNSCMFREAIKTFGLLSEIGTGAVKLRALRKATVSAFHCGDTALLQELKKKTEPYSSIDRLESARVLLDRGRIFSVQSLGPEALHDFETALQIFEEEYSPRDTAIALIGLSARHPGLGKPHEGIAECLRAIALLEEVGDSISQLEAYYNAGFIFNMCLLENEALGMFAKLIEINDKLKMGDYFHLVFANAFSSKSFIQLGNLDVALSYSLKALKFSEKTDSTIARGVVYSLLSRLYAKTEVLDSAERYFEKLMNLPPETLVHPYVRSTLSKAVFFALKKQWKESTQYFNEAFKMFKIYSGAYGNIEETKLFYSWALERQGCIKEAKLQLEEIDQLRSDARERFQHMTLQANLMVKAKVTCGQTFEARLDIINVSKSLGFLVRVDNVLCPELKLKSYPQEYVFEHSSIDMNQKKLLPFQITTIKLKLQATKTGVFNFSPQVVYIDDLGKTRICEPKAISINVEPEPVSESVTDLEKGKAPAKTLTLSDAQFEFTDKHAQKAFEYLVNSFVEDYMRRRITLEKSGWRSLVDVVNYGKLPKSAMYGQRGHKGKALSELENRGFVEVRFFLGERGRGGKIRKVKVAYENEIIKHRIENRIVKKKE